MESRQEIREGIEKALDDMQPQEKRMETWGVEMSAQDFALLKERAEARRAKRTAQNGAGA